VEAINETHDFLYLSLPSYRRAEGFPGATIIFWEHELRPVLPGTGSGGVNHGLTRRQNMKLNSGLTWFGGMMLFFGSLTLFHLQGCGGGGAGTGGGTSTGTLQAAITDTPAPATFASVHVTIDKVVAVPAGKEGAADNDQSLPVIASFPGGLGVDILNLHFIPQVLGNAVLPAGNYTQVRLILAPNQPALNNYVTLTGNPASRLALTTPSAQETGLKIIGKFTVSAGVLSTIVLDFNPSAAIVVAGNSGNINLKPTGIRILQVFNSLANAGSIFGTIHSPAFSPWSSATITVAPRNPAAAVITSGNVFSNFSSPSIWKAPFSAFVPANGSVPVPSANYRVFIQAFRDTGFTTPAFGLYSSPLLVVSTGVDTPVSPNGVAQLKP